MAKDRAEVTRDSISSLLKRRNRVHRSIDFVLQAGDGSVANSTRHNQVEVTKVGRHIQSKSMRSNTARDMNSDSSNLLLRDRPSRQRPDASALRNSLGDNAIACTSANEHLFQLANIVHRAKTRREAAQIDDRIADKLSRAVIGHVSAAVDLVDFDSATSEEFSRSRECSRVANCGRGLGLVDVRGAEGCCRCVLDGAVQRVAVEE